MFRRVMFGVQDETFTYGERDKKIDVYAFAVTMFEVLTEKSAWEGLSLSEIQDNVINDRRPQFPEKARTNEFWSTLVIACWDPLPENRPSFQKIHLEIEMNLQSGSEPPTLTYIISE